MYIKPPLPKSFKTQPLNVKFDSLYSEAMVSGIILQRSKLGELSKCVNTNNTSIPKADYDLFLERFNETSLCFNFVQDLSIGGDIYYNSKAQKGSLVFSINICDIIGIQNCTAADIIESNKNSKNFKLRYFYNNNFVDIKDHKGYSSFLETSELTVDMFYKYEIKLIFQKQILRTDMNPIYSFFPIEEKVFYVIRMVVDRTLNTDLNLVPTNIKGDVNAGNYTIPFSYEILLDTVDVVWSRSYAKLNDLLGSIYSLCRLVYYVYSYFVNYVSDGYFNYKFSKKISVFKKEKKKLTCENDSLKVFEHNNSEPIIIHNRSNNSKIIRKSFSKGKELENLNMMQNTYLSPRPKTNGDPGNENKDIIDSNNHNNSLNSYKNSIPDDFQIPQNKHPFDYPKIVNDESQIINTFHLNNKNKNKFLTKSSYPLEGCYIDNSNLINHLGGMRLSEEDKLKKSKTFFKLKNRNILGDNDTEIISNEEKQLVNSQIKISNRNIKNIRNKSLQSNNINDYDKYSKAANYNEENEKVLNLLRLGSANSLVINKVNDLKISDILDPSNLMKKKLLKKLKSINLDNSNKINLRIGKCFVIMKNLFFCLYKKNKDYRTLAISKEITNHELDIVFITKKLIEYENFKNILIDSNKTEMLKYLQKRVFFEKMEVEDINNFYNNIFSLKELF